MSRHGQLAKNQQFVGGLPPWADSYGQRVIVFKSPRSGAPSGCGFFLAAIAFDATIPRRKGKDTPKGERTVAEGACGLE